jgi:hypothetical protein
MHIDSLCVIQVSKLCRPNIHVSNSQIFYVSYSFMSLRHIVHMTRKNTRRHMPEDDTLHNHRCENLKSYILFICHTALEVTHIVCVMWTYCLCVIQF